MQCSTKFGDGILSDVVEIFNCQIGNAKLFYRQKIILAMFQTECDDLCTFLLRCFLALGHSGTVSLVLMASSYHNNSPLV